MNTKKLLTIIGNGYAILTFVAALATLLGVFVAPHLLKYILAVAVWFILSVCLWGIWRTTYRHKKEKNQRDKYLILSGFAFISFLLIAFLADLFPHRYSTLPFSDMKFGIVLAEFTYGNSNLSYPDGRDRRDILYDDMKRLMQRPDLNLDQTVIIQKYAPINSAEEAQKVGENLNADLVVWGYISPGENGEMHPNFTILRDSEDELPGSNLFNVQISGINSASMLTNRTRAITSYILSLRYLSSADRSDYYTAIRLLNAGILEAEDEYENNPIRKTDLSYNLALLHSGRGRAYAALDDSESALDDYNIALSYAPDYSGAYIGIGNIYYGYFQESHEAKYLDSAHTYFEKALPAWGAYYGLGLVSHSRENYSIALDFFQDALSNALNVGVSANSTPVMKIHFMIGQSYKGLGMLGNSENELTVVCNANKIDLGLKNWACADLNALNSGGGSSPNLTPCPTTPGGNEPPGQCR